VKKLAAFDGNVTATFFDCMSKLPRPLLLASPALLSMPSISYRSPGSKGTRYSILWWSVRVLFSSVHTGFREDRED
jgi:hypothetical protein